MDYKDIPNYPNYRACSDGRIYSVLSNKFLKPGNRNSGYLFVSLYPKRSVSIHRIIALSFLGPPNGRQVNHKDGNKINNKVDNLEYISAKENIRHSWKLGLSKIRKGDNAPNLRFTETLKREIIEKYTSGKYTQKELGKEYTTSGGHICWILKRGI